MRVVEIKLKNVRPAVCPAGKKNCIGCSYKMTVGLLLHGNAPVVICGCKEEEENEEEKR